MPLMLLKIPNVLVNQLLIAFYPESANLCRRGSGKAIWGCFLPQTTHRGVRITPRFLRIEKNEALFPTQMGLFPDLRIDLPLVFANSFFDNLISL
jgi:hypothetical protein